MTDGKRKMICFVVVGSLIAISFISYYLSTMELINHFVKR